MTLEIDTSRALRSHAQLTELVETLARANPGEQETYSLEWKSSLAIDTDADARFKLGKQVIGFANRHPDEAAKTFDGCGYILIGAAAGVEPAGIERHDAAKLWDWTSPYVGTDGPVWKGDYVTIGERSVLVVTVEAPRWGDPMHLLRKEYGSHAAGTPFIRRPGMTAQADVGEMRMLEQRAKRTASHARLEVEFDGPTPTVDSYRTLPEEWGKWGRRRDATAHAPARTGPCGEDRPRLAREQVHHRQPFRGDVYTGSRTVRQPRAVGVAARDLG
jgi:hypothetical protein